MTKTGQWLADWMADDGAIDRLPDGWDDPHALVQKIEAEAAGEPDQCLDRCEGRIGHPGYHQSSDHAAIEAEATAAAEQRLDGLREAAEAVSDVNRAEPRERRGEAFALHWTQAFLRLDEVLGREAPGTADRHRGLAASPRQGEPVDEHDPEAKCRTCGHREHDHHHSAEPRWCGADFEMLGFTACPCPGYAALSEPAEP